MSDVKNEHIKNHLLEPGGRMKIHGKGYNEKSMFHKVDIEVKNDKDRHIMVRLTETGLFIELVRAQ